MFAFGETWRVRLHHWFLTWHARTVSQCRHSNEEVVDLPRDLSGPRVLQLFNCHTCFPWDSFLLGLPTTNEACFRAPTCNMPFFMALKWCKPIILALSWASTLTGRMGKELFRWLMCKSPSQFTCHIMHIIPTNPSGCHINFFFDVWSLINNIY